MKLTVLGKSPAWTDAGGACSGYLVEGDSGGAFLLDCGNGVFGKLRDRLDYRVIEAVVVSHLHGDHLLDLVPFAYARTVGPDAVANASAARPRLIAPPGADAFFRRLAGTWGDEGLIAAAFEIEEYRPDAAIEVCGVAVCAHPVPHFGPTNAIELRAREGGRIVFGADGRFSDELIAAAADAELLIAEATLAEADTSPVEDRGHMCALEAGRLAERAGVGRLVLTHISDELDLDSALEQARLSFDGPVEVAAEGSTYVV
jgi:ribonuclease BN (tRNA processing enzyme)